MIIFNYLFYLLILFCSIQLVCNKNNIENIIISSLISLFCVIQYILFNAPDVAITEASIGASISSIFALKFLSQSKLVLINNQNSLNKKTYNGILNFIYNNRVFIPKITLFLLFIAIFFYSFFRLSLSDLFLSEKFSKFGEFNRNIYNDSIKSYIMETKDKIEIKNLVTSILAFFRSYDTLIETLVILVAGVSVFHILGTPNNSHKIIENEELSKSFIIYRLAMFFIPFIILFGFYIQIYGENSPGGGFQSGVIFASCFILYSIIISEDIVNKFFSIKNLIRLGAFGCFLYLFVGILPILINGVFGDNQSYILNKAFLNYDYLLCFKDIQNLDCIKLSRKIGIFTIEIGVGICVFSIILSLFLNLKIRK
jgi:multicomponent Na+:H+ antiporter subunit B